MMMWKDRDAPGIDPQCGVVVRAVLLDRGDEHTYPMWGLYRWDEASRDYITTNISVRALTYMHALLSFEMDEKERTAHRKVAL